jgi:hypothetical protein
MANRFNQEQVAENAELDQKLREREAERMA